MNLLWISSFSFHSGICSLSLRERKERLLRHTLQIKLILKLEPLLSVNRYVRPQEPNISKVKLFSGFDLWLPCPYTYVYHVSCLMQLN